MSGFFFRLHLRLEWNYKINSYGAGIVLQQVKPPLATCWHSISEFWLLICDWTSAYVTGKAVGDGASACNTATCMAEEFAPGLVWCIPGYCRHLEEWTSKSKISLSVPLWCSVFQISEQIFIWILANCFSIVQLTKYIIYSDFLRKYMIN